MLIQHNILFGLYQAGETVPFLGWLSRASNIWFPAILVLVVLGLLLWHHHGHTSKKYTIRTGAIEFAYVQVSSLIAWLVAHVLKIIIKAPRPPEVFPEILPLVDTASYSFPSGHAVFFASLATIVYLRHPKSGIVMFVFAIWFAISRVIAGVHFPVDIAVGFALGMVLGVVLDKVYRFYFKEVLPKEQ